MIARVAFGPRICLACRFRSQKLSALPTRPQPRQSRSPGVRLASDFSPQSKERIEALISGTLDNLESTSKKKPSSRHRRVSAGQRRRQAALDNEPAEWELDSEQEATPALENAGTANGSSAEHDESVSGDHHKNNETAAEEQPSSSPLPTRVFKHDLLNHQSLGVDALGKPVEALIIKNPNKLRRAKKNIPVLEEQTDGSGDPIRWQSFVRDEGAPETDFTEEVWANIDELQPKDTTLLPRRDVNKLIDQLVDGFTKDQLAGYFNRGNWDSSKGGRTPVHSWIERQGAWEAAQSNHWDRLRPKQQHAAIIITAVWGIEVQEQVEGLGRTKVWLRPDMLRALSKSLTRILTILSTAYLDKSNNERITVNFEESRLSIYTRKATVSTILDRLNEIIQSITTRELQVDSVDADNLGSEVLIELGKITNTALEYNAETRKLAISWLAEDDVSNGQTEDLANIVMRLLADRKPAARHQKLGYARTQEAFSDEGILEPYRRDKKNLPWRDRLRQWSRKVNPLSKATGDSPKPLDLSRYIDMAPNDNSLQGAQRQTTATFGHLLHQDSVLQNKSNSPAGDRRLMSPFVPHPAALADITANSVEPCERTAAIILKFAPETNRTAPHLQLSLPINPFSDLSDFSLHETSEFTAIIPQRLHDICLPDESVDVRVEESGLFPLDKEQETLLKFLADSEFNLLKGRLRTPQRASFSIPSNLLDEAAGTRESQVTEIQYDFMGLEIHQTVSMPWYGYILRYKSIEAGQQGGQRQELSLLADVTSESNVLQSEQRTLSFVELAGQVATGQHFSWTEGYKLMEERSANRFGWESVDEEVGATEASAELDGEHTTPM